jgi:acetylornithine deacetylase/succinyl-diaminopimelate desuccinylase-like protein
MSPQAYLVSRYERILTELIEFVSIPSISTDPAHKADIERAAHWVADQLRSIGPFEVRILPTVRHPMVYAEWLGAPSAPTILVYGHYDVQPPDPLDRWVSAPFKPTVRDGRLYARGVSDDKGPMFIPIKVAEAFFATRGALPINVKLMIEGEEEIGSASLESFIAEHRALLAADWVLSADGAMWRSDVPSVTFASRGMVALEFSLQGAGKDLHSGRYGGFIANPLHAMAELVASLHTPEGRVAVEGFYDSVETLSQAEREAIQTLPFDETRFLEQVGAPEPFGEPGYSTLERQWTRPTLEMNGVWGGYQGPGSKTVTPSEAHAKITCRLVPSQTPETILAVLVRHLETRVPRGVRLTMTHDRHQAMPYRIPADHIGLTLAKSVLREVYGQEPLTVRMGGTLPVSELFKRLLGIDSVFFSFSTADEDFHAPNEFFRIQRLRDGLKSWALYWERAAAQQMLQTL